MKKITFVILSLLFASCNNYNSFDYPKTKTWKHGVYSKEDARKYEKVFDGLEVDVIFSIKKNNIFVGRVEADTSANVPLDVWLSKLEKPKKLRYWIDFKNLSEKNAAAACAVLDSLTEKYKIFDKVFVESRDIEALKIVKEEGYHVMYWVENINYWKKKINQTHKDSVLVCKIIREGIEELHPHAISCEYTMYPILCDSFPEQNIHFWHTPKKYTPENVEYTKMMCEDKRVKIVLVDYPNPVD